MSDQVRDPSNQDDDQDDSQERPAWNPLRRRKANSLETGWVKRRLIIDLAKDERTQYELADRYGCSQPAISAFKKRHQLEIASVLDDLSNEYAGLWIAEKSARIAEYQADVDQVNELLQLDMFDDDIPAEVKEAAVTHLPALQRQKARALRNVAEEMGHLPARTIINVNDRRASYSVEGVDLEQLR